MLKGVKYVMTQMPFEDFFEFKTHDRLNLPDEKAVRDYQTAEGNNPKYYTSCRRREFADLPTIKLTAEEEIFARSAVNNIENREKFNDYYHYMVKKVPFNPNLTWRLVWHYLNNLLHKFKPNETAFAQSHIELIAEYVVRQINNTIQTTFVRKFKKPYDVLKREARDRERGQRSSQRSNEETQ